MHRRCAQEVTRRAGGFALLLVSLSIGAFGCSSEAPEERGATGDAAPSYPARIDTASGSESPPAPHALAEVPPTADAGSVTCTHPRIDDCSFYRACVEPAIACGDAGYALSFGEPLCTLFLDAGSTFSPQGQMWLRQVRLCLQERLVPLIAEPLSCEALAAAAFDSHAGCYTEGALSICDLAPSDLTKLVELLAPQFRDTRTRRQVIDVAARCALTW